MITSLFSPAVRTPVSQTTQKSSYSHTSPLFSGKQEAKDTVSFKKRHAASGAATNATNKKALFLLSLLASAGMVDAAPSKSRHSLFKRGDIPDLKVNQTIDSLLPGLTNDQAVEMLKRPPFEPTFKIHETDEADKNILNSAVYADVSAPPAAERVISDDEVKGKLKETLAARFGKNDPQVDAGMALFDDANLKKVVPDARLRGALINLQGTTGEAAIDAYKNGVFGNVDFADLDQDFIGRSITLFNETAPRVQINRRYQFEDFPLHSPVLGHEALHQDLHVSVAEERIAHALDSLVYGQLLLENPDLLANNTEYTQRLNTKLMARLNTRDKDGNVRLYTSQGNVYPGGKVPLSSFGDNFMDTGIDTSNGVTDTVTSPGNAVLRGQLKKSSGKQNDTADFDGGTEAVIDQNQNALDARGLVALAKVLKLDIGDVPKASPTSSTSASGSASSSTAPGPTHTDQTSDARHRRHRMLWWWV